MKPHPCKVLFLNYVFHWAFNSLPFYSIRLANPGWCSMHYEQWILWSWAPTCPSFAVKCVCWSDTEGNLLGNQTFYKPPDTGAGQSPAGRKVNHSYMEYVYTLVKMNHSSFHDRSVLVVRLPQVDTGLPKGWCCICSSALVSATGSWQHFLSAVGPG